MLILRHGPKLTLPLHVDLCVTFLASVYICFWSKHLLFMVIRSPGFRAV